MVREVIGKYEGEEVEVSGRVSVRYPQSQSGKICIAPVKVKGEVEGEDHMNIFPSDYRNMPVPDIFWQVRRGDVIVVKGVVSRYNKRGGYDYCIRNPQISVVEEPRVAPVNRKVVHRARKPSYDDIPEGC